MVIEKSKSYEKFALFYLSNHKYCSTALKKRQQKTCDALGLESSLLIVDFATLISFTNMHKNIHKSIFSSSMSIFV